MIRQAPWAAKAGLVVLGALFVLLAWYSSTRSIDFQIYHRVAGQVLRGDYEIYPPAVYDGTDRGDSHEFQYAPIVAFLFVPFGVLPLQAAAFLFACLKIPAYAYMAWVIARRCGVESRYATLIWMALFVAGGYLVEEFRNGNFHAFMGLLMVVAFDQSERGRTLAPAAALALAIVAKLTPLALLGYFAVRRRFALCAATIAMIGVLWALPALVVGFSTNTHLTEGFVRSAAGIADESDNYSLRGALLRTFTVNPFQNPDYEPTNIITLPANVVSVAWVALLLVLGVAMAVVVWRPPLDSMSPLLELSLVVTAILVVSPHTQRMHFSTLVVPAASLIALLMASPRLPRAWLVKTAIGVNAAAATVLPLVFGGRRASLAYQAFSPYLVATLALLVVLIVLIAELKAAGARRAGDAAHARTGS